MLNDCCTDGLLTKDDDDEVEYFSAPKREGAPRAQIEMNRHFPPKK